MITFNDEIDGAIAEITNSIKNYNVMMTHYSPKNITPR
jgi:hypothetical protein